MTLQRQKDFLFQSYFGDENDELDRFISRAYRDMNRTLHGIGKLPSPHKTRIFDGATKLLKDSVIALSKKAAPRNPTLETQEFDSWHGDLCRELKQYYATELKNFEKIRFTYGQAQKWVNMTMKYCWVFDVQDLAGLNPWYSVAHIAVDEVILVASKEQKVIENRPINWSIWDNPEEYQDFQDKVRKVAREKNQTPLELEFDWWKDYRSKALKKPRF